MRAVVAVARVVVGVVVAATASCGGPAPIGDMPCRDPSLGDAGATFAYSPSPDCASRICLVEYVSSAPPGGATAVCTRECSSDADCDTATRVYCPVGYGCGEVAGYAHAVCVCRALYDGGAP